MIQRIIALREAKKLSQEQFAAKIGVSRNFISLVENGKRNLSERTIEDICDKLNVNKEWLLTGKGGEKAMFSHSPKTVIDEFADKLKLESRDRILIEKFLALSEEGRQAVMDYALSVAAAAQEENRKSMRELAADLYDEQNQAEEKPDAPASSANGYAVG